MNDLEKLMVRGFHIGPSADRLSSVMQLHSMGASHRKGYEMSARAIRRRAERDARREAKKGGQQ